MAKFPSHTYGGAAAYASAYVEEMKRAYDTLDQAQLQRAAGMLAERYASGRWIFVCGNGGSAAIANHLVCDHLKGIQTDTDRRPRVVSLSTNIELITAVANDVAFADVFVYQLRTLASPGDALITISASGDSENVVRAQKWARENGVAAVALTGFGGGRTRAGADCAVHVDAENYGIVEDVHQSVMHILAQYLRLSAMPEKLLAERKF